MPTPPKPRNRSAATASGRSSSQGAGEQPPARRRVQEMVRPPLQPRSEQNLGKMVAACRALAEQRGNLDEISLNDIVGTAKTSIGAFYARFKDKGAFLGYVLDVALREAEEVTLRSVAEDPVWQSGPAEAIVERIVRLYVGQFRENRGLFRGFLRHYSSRGADDNPMREANRRIARLVMPWLTSQLAGRTQETAAFEVRAAMQFLLGTLSNLLLNDPGPLRLDGDELEVHLNRMLKRYLGLDDGAPASGRRRVK